MAAVLAQAEEKLREVQWGSIGFGDLRALQDIDIYLTLNRVDVEAGPVD